MKRLFKPLSPMQIKLYQLWCLFHRICFGLNDPHDSLPNHNGHLFVGDDCWFAGDVRFIQCNHDSTKPSQMLPYEDIRIGSHCWFGAGSIVLPGVELGDFTTVGAGAVVTKSFPDGHVVLCGVPARAIRRNP